MSLHAGREQFVIGPKADALQICLSGSRNPSRQYRIEKNRSCACVIILFLKNLNTALGSTMGYCETNIKFRFGLMSVSTNKALLVREGRE